MELNYIPLKKKTLTTNPIILRIHHPNASGVKLDSCWLLRHQALISQDPNQPWPTESGRLVIVVPNSPCWDKVICLGDEVHGPQSSPPWINIHEDKTCWVWWGSSTPQTSKKVGSPNRSQPWTSLNAWQASERTTECGRPNWLVTQRPGRPVELVGFVGSSRAKCGGLLDPVIPQCP